MTLDFSREGPRPSTPGGPHGGPLKDPPANNNVGKLSAASALLFLGFFLFACTYTFGVAAPVPVPPSPPDAPSVASFYERRQQQHDNPRLLLPLDFPLGRNGEDDGIKMAREQYPALLAYIEGEVPFFWVPFFFVSVVEISLHYVKHCIVMPVHSLCVIIPVLFIVILQPLNAIQWHTKTVNRPPD